MLWRPALAAWAAALALAGGCYGGGDDGGDGAGGDGCVGVEQVGEGGEVAIGTGYDEFESLTDEIRIIGGPQGGFHLNLNARVAGLDLGDPDDLFDPNNPTTLFSIYTADERERLDIDACPVRVGYEVEGDHGVLRRGVSVVFAVEDHEELEPLYDGPIVVRVDVVDAEGLHTEDERTITVRAPGSSS